jgi:hypothetical protein
MGSCGRGRGRRGCEGAGLSRDFLRGRVLFRWDEGKSRKACIIVLICLIVLFFCCFFVSVVHTCVFPRPSGDR